MGKEYSILGKAHKRDVRDELLRRGYKAYDELGDESFLREDLGITLDLKIPSIEEVKDYRGLFPNGIKFPSFLIIIDTEAVKIFRPNDSQETLDRLAEREAKDIVSELKRSHPTDSYVVSYSQGDLDKIVGEIRRLSDE